MLHPTELRCTLNIVFNVKIFVPKRKEAKKLMVFSFRNETGKKEVKKKVSEAKQSEKMTFFVFLSFEAEKFEAKRCEIIVDCETRLCYTINDPAPWNG
jgi:hypothetical protein